MRLLQRKGEIVLSLLIVALAPLYQIEFQIESKQSCRECEITIEHVARFGAEEGPNSLMGPPVSIVLRSNGLFYLVDENDARRIRIFDQSGTNLRNIGRRGKGPGEYGMISQLVLGLNDTIYVFDGWNQRLTVLDARDSIAREERVQPFVYDAELLPQSRFLIASNITSQDAVGYPLHQLSATGQVIKSFGMETAIYRADAKNLLRRKLAADSRIGICSARESEYVIECWRRDGTLVARFVRDADWFKPYVRRTDVTPSMPPVPLFVSISVDADGLLWTNVQVPRKDYRKALGKPRRLEGRVVYPVEKPEGIRTTILEVIDPSTRRVVTRRRFNRWTIGMFGQNYLLTYSEPNGVPYVDIWRTELRNFKKGR